MLRLIGWDSLRCSSAERIQYKARIYTRRIRHIDWPRTEYCSESTASSRCVGLPPEMSIDDHSKESLRNVGQECGYTRVKYIAYQLMLGHSTPVRILSYSQMGAMPCKQGSSSHLSDRRGYIRTLRDGHWEGCTRGRGVSPSSREDSYIPLFSNFSPKAARWSLVKWLLIDLFISLLVMRVAADLCHS